MRCLPPTIISTSIKAPNRGERVKVPSRVAVEPELESGLVTLFLFSILLPPSPPALRGEVGIGAAKLRRLAFSVWAALGSPANGSATAPPMPEPARTVCHHQLLMDIPMAESV